MPTPPQTPRQLIVAALADGPRSTPQLVEIVGSREATRRALRDLAPALVAVTGEHGRRWYRVDDIPLAKRLAAPRRPGPKPLLATIALDHLEGGVWRSTGRLARAMEEDPRVVYRALSRRPDLFSSRRFRGRRLWRARGDG